MAANVFTPPTIWSMPLVWVSSFLTVVFFFSAILGCLLHCCHCGCWSDHFLYGFLVAFALWTIQISLGFSYLGWSILAILFPILWLFLNTKGQFDSNQYRYVSLVGLVSWVLQICVGLEVAGIIGIAALLALWRNANIRQAWPLMIVLGVSLVVFGAATQRPLRDPTGRYLQWGSFNSVITVYG